MNTSDVATSLDNATLAMLISPVTTVALPIIYLIVFVVSTPCNLISFCVLLGLAKRKTPTVIFSLNLCLADLLYSISLPLQVAYHLWGNDWHFGSVACGVSTFAFYCNLKCSILTTCAIAVERYCGVVHPMMMKNRRRSAHKAILICVLIWVLVFAMNAQWLHHNLVLFIPELKISTCFDVLPRKLFPAPWVGYLYFGVLLLLVYVLPLAVLIWCYLAVALALRKTVDASTRRSHKRTQAVVLIGAVCFLICYLPNIVLQLIHMLYRARGKSVYEYYKITLGVNSLNCCVDPFLYYLASSEFRHKVMRYLRRLPCCAPGEGEEIITSNMSEVASFTRGPRRDNGTSKSEIMA
ncbi:P2Y purinoceptor 8-like [Chanos chanos]|uniref:P2Y purinoceptor 8-like n=1 Tax=Chanos chanos TaxID=29144 RepID=A0A6J2VPG3_CHACN|nr:P2Y purinoceptor 8-like [Chanos chanos]